jgi:hypothetical protein
VEECVRAALTNTGRLLAVSGHVMVIVLITTYVAGRVVAAAAPGLVALLQLWTAVPVVIFERLAATAAIKRSRDLIRGHEPGILGIIVALGLAAVLVDQAIKPPAVVYEGTWRQRLLALDGAFMLAQGFAWTCVFAVIAAVSYVLLRKEKGDWDVEGIARVFE